MRKTKLRKIIAVVLTVSSWLLFAWPGIPFVNFPPELTKVHAANTVDTENDTSTQYETVAKAFRNPVGNQNYYTFYQNAGGGGRRDGVYAWSSTGTGSWTTDVDPGTNDLDVGATSGVDMFVVGTTLHSVHITPDFNDKTSYVHGSVATGVDDFTWGTVQNVGSCEKGHNFSAAIDSAGRAWMACASNSGDSYALYLNADNNSSDPGSPPDAPSWTGNQSLDTSGSVQKYVAIVNIGSNAIGAVWQNGTGSLNVAKASMSGGSMTISNTDTLSSLTMTDGMFALVSDNSTNGHVLYKDGSNLVHRKIDFFDTNPVFGSSVNVLTEAVDTLALSHNSTDSEIVAFYVKSSDNTDIWYNISDDSTISFGTESEIDDTGSTALTNLSAGRTDWNDDSYIQLTYGYVSTGTVRFHEQFVGTLAVSFTQNTYRWYVDDNTADPADEWSSYTGVDLAENTAITLTPFTYDPPGYDATGSAQKVRLRINYTVNNTNLAINEKYFKLEYKQGTDGSCTTGAWYDVQANGTGAEWDFADSAVADGATISAKLSDTTSGRIQEYIKEKPSNLNPVAANQGENIEYDYHIIYGATASANTTYSFRVVETNSGGTSETTFDAYTYCPTLTTEPDTDILMRHGNVYGEGGAQGGFYWAD